MSEITRFDQDMDGSMEPSESGQWVRYDDIRETLDERRSVCESQMREIERLREDVRRQAASAHKLLDTQLAQRTLNAELADALENLRMTAARYLPDHEEHSEIQRADAALAKVEPKA